MENLKVVFKADGFTPGEDISWDEFFKMTEQFVQMYNIWTVGMNEALEKINDIWNRYEDMLNMNSQMGVMLFESIMGIDHGADYNDWIEKWYKEIAEAVDLGFLEAPLKGYIFRDGEMPVYGVQLKDKPDWKIHLNVVPS